MARLATSPKSTSPVSAITTFQFSAARNRILIRDSRDSQASSSYLGLGSMRMVLKISLSSSFPLCSSSNTLKPAFHALRLACSSPVAFEGAGKPALASGAARHLSPLAVRKRLIMVLQCGSASARVGRSRKSQSKPPQASSSAFNSVSSTGVLASA